MAAHHYRSVVTWTGNSGAGTRDYRSYGRSHDIAVDGRPTLHGSADPAFRGDPARHSPEDLLLAAVSACHMLWFLHLCGDAGIVVTAYVDRAEGVMTVAPDGGGRFTRIVLRPEATVAGYADAATMVALHRAANARCFIAQSLNLPVEHEPVTWFATAG